MASTSKMALKLAEQLEGTTKEECDAENMMPIFKNQLELSEKEREQYDRQIRLWGLENQKALRSTNILLSGMNGLGAEVLKNILLTGVKSMTLLDAKEVTEEDFSSQYLIPRSTLGSKRAKMSLPRAHKLNKSVKLIADIESLSEKTDEYFEQFNVVILIGSENEEILRVNKICREKSIKFFAGDVWGIFGWFFLDLQSHDYLEDIGKYKVTSKPNEKIKTELVTKTVRKTVNFSSYQAVMDFDIASDGFCKKLKKTGPSMVLLRIMQAFRTKHKRDPDYNKREEDTAELVKIRDKLADSEMVPNELFDLVFAQLAPGTAVLGGIMAQEIIKSITRKGIPINNIFLFDPVSYCGFIETIV